MLANNFEKSMKDFKFFECTGCKERILTRNEKCVHKNSCKDFSEENNMDPGDVPDELKDLTFVEELLIAQIHPLISVFKLKGLQLGYSGNVINFSQDISSFTKQLSHRVQDLPAILILKADNPDRDASFFRVRSEKVLNALFWLKQNNKFYKNIEISHANLDLLPVDGNVMSAIQVIKDSNVADNSDISLSLRTEEHGNENIRGPKNQTEIVDRTNFETDQEGDNNYINNDEINFSILNSDSSSENERENFCSHQTFDCDGDEEAHSANLECESINIHHSGVPLVHIENADNSVKNKVFDWPILDCNPVNEYKTEGYIACAFPVLFPYGNADLRSIRDKKIKPAEYFKHLLHYYDGRFAKHSTFRFFAMNSVMRWTASDDGDIFIRNNPEFKDMTVTRLKQLLEEKPEIIKKIMFQGVNLRGSKPYWCARCGEITDMVEQLGLPTFFITLSCADFHWQDLYKLLTGQSDISHVTEKDRRDLLQENPLIVDAFFSERVDCFIEEVLKPKMKITDFWYRVEYQHRGSPHIHGVFWCDGAPNVSNLDTLPVEEVNEIAQWFGNWVTAKNPDRNVDIQGDHPCRKLYMNVDASLRQKDLSELLVTVQRHTKCSADYCLRVNKKTKQRQCRFNFPQPLQEGPKIEKDEKGNWQFLPARDDDKLNKYNPFLLQLWRANLDISPVLSKAALLQYLAKYISKCEIKSNSLKDMIKQVVSDFTENDNILKALKRIFIKTSSERDFSAQEVCHILSSRKLYSAGQRQFVIINFNRNKEWIPVVNAFHNENEKGKSVIEKYQERENDYEHMSLWNACKNYNITSKKWHKKRTANIVRVFPKLSLSHDNNKNEEFYKQKIFLHVPWRVSSCFSSDGFTSWKERFENLHVRSLMENQCDFSVIILDDEEFEDIEYDRDERNENLEEFMIASRMAPRTILPDTEIGLRECDLNHNWSDNSSDYSLYGSLNELQSFIKRMKDSGSYGHERNMDFNTSNIEFSDEQLQVIEQINQQLNYLTCGEESLESKRMLTIVQGKAGTGKSLFIKYIVSSASTKLKTTDAVLLLGPTGVSALNIGGRTIHSALHIPIKKDHFKPLTGDLERQFCNLMDSVKIIIIDEYSMIGCAMLRMIDLRCRQGTGKDEPFGGLYVYLLGDCRQLPSIDTPLYGIPSPFDELGYTGKLLLSSFQKVFFLTKCFRQKDKEFQNMLDHLSTGDLTELEYNKLKQRFSSNVSNLEDFSAALNLFPTRREVWDHNVEVLGNMKNSETGLLQPIARVKAQHNIPLGEKRKAEDAEQLESVLYLTKGCQILLITNLWTEKGLVNGSIGIVVDILYKPGESPPYHFPEVIVCKFPSYSGPGLGIDNLVPISPKTASWTDNKITYSRRQFPIVVCYACTIYKSQGLTLEKAKIDIGHKEYTLGTTYVALSRVKSLNGLLLKDFSYKRISGLKFYKAMALRLKFDEFLKSLS